MKKLEASDLQKGMDLMRSHLKENNQKFVPEELGINSDVLDYLGEIEIYSKEMKNSGLDINSVITGVILAVASLQEEVEEKVDCNAIIFHGPGHQTVAQCERKDEHDIHSCKLSNRILQWEEEIDFTTPDDKSPLNT